MAWAWATSFGFGHLDTLGEAPQDGGTTGDPFVGRRVLRSMAESII